MIFRKFNYLTEKREADEFYQAHGVVVFTNLADAGLLAAIRDDVGRLIARQVQRNLSGEMHLKAGNGFDRGLLELSTTKDDLRRRTYEILQSLPSLYRFGVQDSLQRIVQDYGVKFPVLRTSQVRMDIPKDERFLILPHQEIKSIRSPNMVFMITALVDTPAKKGALKVAPGSFKLGPIQPSVSEQEKYQFIPGELYEKDFPLVQAELNAGETIVINMYTIHGSSQNFTDETRWSVIVRYEDIENMPYLDGDDSLDAMFNLKG